MAGVTSGSVSTGKYDGRYYTCSWTATQDVNTNKTTVKWTIKAVGGNSSWYAERTLSLKVTSDNSLSGTTSYSKSARVERYTGTVKTGTFTITHDSSGDASFKMVLKAAVYTSTVNCTGSKTFELKNIPRKSELTVYAGTLNTVQTLKVTQKSSAFTHTIVAVCGEKSKTICTKSTGLSFAFTPPIDWASENTSGKTVSVIYQITTYNGTTSLGNNSYTVSCTIPEVLVRPELEVEIEDTTGYFGIYEKYIQGRSILKITASAAGQYGATIKSYKTTVDGSTFTSAEATTNVLKGSGELSLVCVVTDSRGYTKTITQTLEVLAYSVPRITALIARRCDENGASNSTGDYLKVEFSSEVTPLEEKNTVKVTVEYKKSTDDSYEQEEIPMYANQYSITNGSFIFEADKAYTYNIILHVEDAFIPADKSTTGSSEKVLWSRLWKGLGFAFGKVAELEGVLEVAFKTKLTGGILQPVLEDKTDLDDMTTPNTYDGKNAGDAEYLNCPDIGNVPFILEVMTAGEGQVLHRLTTFETSPKVYCRIYSNTTLSWSTWN